MNRPIICLDPGHGGTNRGTGALRVIDEADYMLMMARRIKALYHEIDYPFDLIYTRHDDATVPFPVRACMAQEAKTNLVISLHVNANEDNLRRGFYTLHWPGNAETQMLGDWFCNAAPQYLKRFKINESLPAEEDTFPRARHVCKQYKKLPVLIIEFAHATNDYDRGRLLDIIVQDELAKLVLNGCEYFSDRLYPQSGL